MDPTTPTPRGYETNALISFLSSVPGAIENVAPRPENAARSGQIQQTTYTASVAPRLFALLIGINYYDHVKSLRGAVGDALAIKEYLETNLNVPPDQIYTLLNRAASRSAIIDALASLSKDHRIENGDAILIYYAGHGSEIPSPPGWDHGGSDSNIQMLVPRDYCSIPGKNSVQAIPDRTIAALIDNIAEMKGDNITVILDCCHSGSGTRKGTIDPSIRQVEIDPNLPPDTDREIWEASTRSSAIPSKFLRTGLRSHVLLAACSAFEIAKEQNGRGNFTSALLNLLRTVGPENLRYCDILERMDVIPGQNPQCEGINQKKFMFNKKVSSRSAVFYRISMENSGFVLDGGAAHGITEGAEFTIYADYDSLSVPLGVLVTQKVGALRSDLTPPPGALPLQLTQPAIAQQTSAGDREHLRLFVPLLEELRPFFETVFTLSRQKFSFFRNISLVRRPEDAHLEISLEDGEAVFLYRDERITTFGFKRIFYSVTPNVDDLLPILRAADHFWWEMNRTINNPEVTGSVRLEFYQLESAGDDFDVYGRRVRVPSGPNICQDNVVDIVVDEDAIYGLRLVNDSSLDLFPNLFYFDNSDLSISTYYQSPTSGKYSLDVPLKKGGALTIGYGSGGSPAFTYFLRPEQDIDVGFLKLFLSTKPIDLSTIPQESPFELSRSIEDPKKGSADAWGTILIPVIQRRFPKEKTEDHPLGTESAISNQNPLEILTDENKMLKAENEILVETLSAQRRRFGEAEADGKRKIEQLQGELATLKEDLEKARGGLQDHSKGRSMTGASGSSNQKVAGGLSFWSRLPRFFGSRA